VKPVMQPVVPAVRPTYVGIGAQKCASTWLHSILAEHPDVGVPATKELDFFSHRYDRGYQWYERCFGDTDSALARGEISPSYFCEPCVPERVARYLPEARILLMLRDPVARALSNHRHEVRSGHLQGSDLSFEAGLANNPMYVDQGLYATHLRNWLRFFSLESVLVVYQEDVEREPEQVARRVYGFLGVDAGFAPPSLRVARNPSYVDRSAGLAAAKDALYTVTRRAGLRVLWEGAARTGLRSAYRRLNRRPSAAVIPAPRPETLALLRKRFEPEVRELESLLARPTPWPAL
jgi:hypothetical protein